MPITKDALMRRPATRIEPVKDLEAIFGEPVYVRRLTGDRRDYWEAHCAKVDDAPIEAMELAIGALDRIEPDTDKAGLIGNIAATLRSVQAAIADRSKDKKRVRGMLAALHLCDAEGTFLFDPEDPGFLSEVEALGAMDDCILDAIVNTAFRLGGLGRSAVDAAKKNSAADPSDASGSSSPAPCSESP